ncbi:MAG: VOC family protein [Bacteroidota bacterium]
MKTNHFIWTDLSSYQPLESINFYKAIFPWSFYEQQGYHLAYQNNQALLGIYETPAFFKKIKMPHFWMNYIQVEEVAKTVALAEAHGGKVEVANAPFYEGKIALIRDPMGAGFTVYEGDALRQMPSEQPGGVLYRALQTSNAAKVIPFYEALFDWKIEADAYAGHYAVTLPNYEVEAYIEEVPNAMKGKYEYWVTVFNVDSAAETGNLILANGGTLIADESVRQLFADPSGEAFFYIQEI